MREEQLNAAFYGEYYNKLVRAQHILEELLLFECHESTEHFKTRIKSKHSALAKLEKLQLAATADNALGHLKDLLGIRIVCRFLSDVYDVAQKIENSPATLHILSKDYIKRPKGNGYRSYHIILEVELNGCRIPAEIQIRTISQDSWASLEHRMKYKKDIANTGMITSELKRLADEMASADVCMQTLKELISESGVDT